MEPRFLYFPDPYNSLALVGHDFAMQTRPWIADWEDIIEAWLIANIGPSGARTWSIGGVNVNILHPDHAAAFRIRWC